MDNIQKMKNLFNNMLIDWSKKNIELFGVDLIDEKDSIESIQAFVNNCCIKYWNTDSNKCILASCLDDEERKLDKDVLSKVRNTYRLELNIRNMCIDIYSSYKVKDSISEFKVAAIPTPTNMLSWIINKTHYTPKIISERDYSLVKMTEDNIVEGNGWNYNIEENKFTWADSEISSSSILETMNERSKLMLQSLIDVKLSLESLTTALSKLKLLHRDSIFFYGFDHIDRFRNIILKTSKYAQPTKGRLLGINKIFTHKSKHSKDLQLIRVTSKIDALFNYRTVENVYFKSDSEFTPKFTYKDTIGFFDAFKTATSGNAGRQRLLLDNIEVDKGVLWVNQGEHKLSMYSYLSTPPENYISCLSEALFCNNNKPKRIMMNAKMKTQAVPLKDDLCELTHQIIARVGFAEIEGYSLSDSIVISESFAKRLTTYIEDLVYIDATSYLFNEIEKIYELGDKLLNVEILKKLYPTKNLAILYSYKNFRVDYIEYVDTQNARLFCSYEIPFKVGDKLTNLHGAKGTVGLILPDDKMPTLKYKLGVMDKGPLDIIFSGYSIVKRGSYGQVFEAWSIASGIELNEGDDYISEVVPKYYDQMQDYSKWSIVEYNGESNKIPVGLIHIMRLHHHAVTHLSLTDTKNTLKLGEMEKLNLLANNCEETLKELALRDPSRYKNYELNVKQIIEERELPDNVEMNHIFFEHLKMLGLNSKIVG